MTTKKKKWICRFDYFSIFIYLKHFFVNIEFGLLFIIGCCFVTFFTRKAALNAQDALHNVKTLAGVSKLISIHMSKCIPLYLCWCCRFYFLVSFIFSHCHLSPWMNSIIPIPNYCISLNEKWKFLIFVSICHALLLLLFIKTTTITWTFNGFGWEEEQMQPPIWENRFVQHL